MAFDAETYTPTAAADSSRDILSPAILAALPADKAQALYELAAQVDHPKVWKLAAHALAGSLARLLAAAASIPCEAISPAQPSSPIRPARKPRTQSAPRLAAGDDLAAPLAAPPRNKTAVGDFHALWADGSVTRVTGVIYHTAKPATRWAAAFQAADRLRRLRGRAAYAADLERNATVARQVRGACGIYQDSPDWMELTRVRPMPALVAIHETEGEAFDAPTGSSYGAGDAEAAREIEARICTPVLPSRPATLAQRRNSLRVHLEIIDAPDFYNPPAQSAPAPATGMPIEPCDLISLRDLDGASVIVDADKIADMRTAATGEALRTARIAAKCAVNEADNEGDLAQAQADLAAAQAAEALHHRAQEAGANLLKIAGEPGARTLFTLRRGIGGRTFDLIDSTGRAVLFTADLAAFLATARPAQRLALAA